MDVGDLIQLSAYARKLKRNKNRLQDVGIIVKRTQWGWFSVKWASDGYVETAVDRREIRYAKA